jgi:dipeptidyl aminopeptidase/acylaminoacyl peptidase
LGSDERLYPLQILEKLEWAPYTFVFHGEQDSAVDVGSSVLFAKKMWGKFGKESVDLVIRPGEEHGFDGDLKLDEEEWLRESLKKVTKLWLGEDEG